MLIDDSESMVANGMCGERFCLNRIFVYHSLRSETELDLEYKILLINK